MFAYCVTEYFIALLNDKRSDLFVNRVNNRSIMSLKWRLLWDFAPTGKLFSWCSRFFFKVSHGMSLHCFFSDLYPFPFRGTVFVSGVSADGLGTLLLVDVISVFIHSITLIRSQHWVVYCIRMGVARCRQAAYLGAICPQLYRQWWVIIWFPARQFSAVVVHSPELVIL